MKFLVVILLTLTATSAMASGEGRYVTVATTSEYGGPAMFVTDTKTGSVRFCVVSITMALSCGLWKAASE